MHKFLELYEYVLKLASHARAKYYLFILSVSESSFFPIPPDVMLLPMCLSNQQKHGDLPLLQRLVQSLEVLLVTS